MKEFIPSFFQEKNFIKAKKVYNYLIQEEKEMHICYNVNDSFSHIMGTSLVSVLENNEGVGCIVHIFTDGFSQKNMEKIEEIAKKWQCCCIVYTYYMQPFEGFHIKVQRFSHIAYGRLYMPKVLKSITDRYIYMDADAICVSPLHDLWTVDLKGKAIGVILDAPDSAIYRSKYLKLTNRIYFNDGIMVVDIKEWEHQEITERTFSYQDEPKERFLGHDQDILNIVMDGNVFLLPSKYNAYGGGKDYLDCDDAVIVHWTGRRKPWQMVLTKFDQQWRHYNALSPWETITNILPVKKPENYHDFQQWGKYQKRNGHMSGYLKGMFWYSWLRIRYKMGL